MKTIIFTSVMLITIMVLTFVATVIFKTTPVETKTVKHRQPHPRFTSTKGHSSDPMEKEVDRILKKRKPSVSEMEYVYNYIMKTGKEKWRYIKGYEGYYRINTYGVIESCRYDRRYLVPARKKNQYMVILSVGGKHKGYSVHRLVAETFIPNSHGAKIVKTKDGNYLNCDVRNLMWHMNNAAVKKSIAA